MAQPWHYIGILDLIDHWQGLEAGIFGFGAAILVVALTLRSERRRAQRELVALRRSFVVEFRQATTAALQGHQFLRTIAQSSTPISARMIEGITYIPEPVVYPASADKIGLFGSEAMDLVALYGVLEAVRASIGRLQRHPVPDKIPNMLVAAVADVLMTFCRRAAAVLPSLKTEVLHIDERDAVLIELIELIGNQGAVWNTARTQWPEIGG